MVSGDHREIALSCRNDSRSATYFLGPRHFLKRERTRHGVASAANSLHPGGERDLGNDSISRVWLIMFSCVQTSCPCRWRRHPILAEIIIQHSDQEVSHTGTSVRACS